MSGNGRSQAKIGTKGMGRKGQPRSQAGGGRMKGCLGWGAGSSNSEKGLPPGLAIWASPSVGTGWGWGGCVISYQEQRHDDSDQADNCRSSPPPDSLPAA